MFRLNRVIATQKFIPEIDGLRFIAIASVIAFHIQSQMQRYYAQLMAGFFQPLQDLIHNGDRGVRLFFVISGFVLALPFARHRLESGKPISLKRYFLRRLTRLEPPYLLDLLALSVLLITVTHIDWRSVLPHLVASALYLHNVIYGHMSTINFVAWSLEVEVQFYILVPLLTAIFLLKNTFWRRAILLFIIGAVGLLETAYPPSQDGRLVLSILYYIHFFLTGFLLADFYILSGKGIRSHGWDVLGALSCAAFFAVPFSILQFCGPLLILAVAWGALKGPLLGGIFRNKFIVTAGGMCYSIYLVHFTFISMATKAVGNHPLAMPFACLLFIAVGGTLYFVFIERPCMNPNWPSELWNKLRANRAQATRGTHAKGATSPIG